MTLMIAVGGTGQHVALAASRLVALGALPPLELAVVDADDSGDLSMNLRTFGSTVSPGYTRHPLGNGDAIYPPFDKKAKQDPKFSDLFVDPNTSARERSVFELCFDADSAGIAVKDGMFGRPAIGVTIFTQNKETQLRPVFERAQLVGPQDHIFVAGSLVGGTGAGILPHVVKSLGEKYAKSTRLYGLVFMRWFRSPTGASKQTISDETLDRNMRYGADYFFREVRPHLKGTLLVGLPDKSPHGKLDPAFLEAGRSDEKKHFFHVAAANGILKLPEIARTEQSDGSIYGLAAEDPASLYEEQWLGEKALWWYVNRAVTVKSLLLYAGSEKFKGEMRSAFGLFGKPDNIGGGLSEAIKRYGKPQVKTVIDELAKTWTLLASQYEFSLKYLDEVLGPLPEKHHTPRRRELETSEVSKVKEIQDLWSTPLPAQQELPKPPEVAELFHRRLVESFK